MAQYDVYRNPNPASRERVPYLLDVQTDILDRLVTRVVVPLAPTEILGRGAERLTPSFQVEGRTVVMLTPEVAGVPRKALGERVGSVAGEREAIIGALDVLFTGI